MFGRIHNSKVKNGSDGKMIRSKPEEEDWEVVKPTTAINPKAKVSGASITDVATQTEQTSREVSKDWRMGSKNRVWEPPTLAKDVNPTTEKRESSAFVASGDVTPIVPFQDLLASITSFLVAEGSKSHFVVKRNLKTVALLFLLGVLCAFKLPDQQRSKRELIWSSSPEAIVPDGNQKVEYELLVQRLRKKVEQLEDNNRHLSMATFERNHWRTMAVSCNHDLRELSSSHSRLEEEVKQSKWLAPVAFVSPAPPRVNATGVATTPYVEFVELPAPEPSPARWMPYPQLALPEPKPMNLLPKPSMKSGRGQPYSALVLAPSVAVAAV